jgi:aarF domain-containing kinase
MKSNHQSRIADLLTIVLGVCFPLKIPKKLSTRSIPIDIAEAFQSSTLKSLKSAPIPSNKISRALYYTGLATSLGVNIAKQSFRTALSKNDQPSRLLSDQGTEKLVDTLKKMRGAALKLGQMLSIQEENPAFPKSVTDIMTTVQNAAYTMPQDQLVKVLANEYKNSNWKSDIYTEFDINPIAAASIGQVHSARLKNNQLVAVKVQVCIDALFPSILVWPHL